MVAWDAALSPCGLTSFNTAYTARGSARPSPIFAGGESLRDILYRQQTSYMPKRYMKFIFSNTMIKNIFFSLAISFCAFLIAPITYACDPLGCLFIGSKQDTLILGEVMSVTDGSRDIKIIFVFPQNQVKSLKDGNIITISNISNTINLTEEESKTITVGKKYLMSLNKNDNFYVPAWGIYEITGTTYSDAKLVENKSIDDKALQIFINSGGTERDFAFDYSGSEPVLIINGERQPNELKEKNILWYGAGIGVLVLIGSLVLISRKKK